MDYRHPLDRGDHGLPVQWAQARLMTASHYTGPIHGRYDRSTVQAVCSFQHERRLTVTGTIDRRTWAALTAQ